MHEAPTIKKKERERSKIQSHQRNHLNGIKSQIDVQLYIVTVYIHRLEKIVCWSADQNHY